MAHESRHLVVDGSNIATESRTLPSLAQLDEAVRAVHAEDPDRQITVIVDATFSHRIDPSEKKAFEEAADNGEILVPPAGAVGRGDAFILQVAEKADAAVLSNDSFQEFHGEHPWLFDEGRLIGGKPVEGIGWVFVPRVPVRGPASRRSTREAKSDRPSGRGRSTSKATKRSRRSRPSKAASEPVPTPGADNPPPAKKERRSSGRSTERRKSDRRDDTSEDRTKAAEAAPAKKRGRAREERSDSGRGNGGDTGDSARAKKNVEELNSTNDFLKFVTQHSIGDDVEAVVERFSSHGCYVRAAGAQCYLPSAAMGDPPPNRARDVVSDGQTIIVKVESIDSDRRGINVVLVRTIAEGAEQDKPAAGRSRGGRQHQTSQPPATVADDNAREANPTRSDTTVATKKTAKKARKRPAAKKTTKKAPAKATASARATKATARKAAKKSTRKVAKKAPAKKSTKKVAKKTAAKKSTKKAPAKKATKKTTARKAPAKKAAKKTTAKKAPAKKATKKTTRKASAKKR